MTDDKEVQKNLKEAKELEEAFDNYSGDIILAVLVNRLNKSTNRLNILTVVLITLTILLAILAVKGLV